MLLQTEHVSKQFNGIYALRDINLSLRAGEIHGLVGENGAGKSTLIKLLTGVYQMQEGTVLWDGRPVSLSSPQDSQKLGIHAIHQDRTLIPAFDCVENAYLGWNTPPGWAGWTGRPCAAGSGRPRTGWAFNWTCGKRRRSCPHPSGQNWRSSVP